MRFKLDIRAFKKELLIFFISFSVLTSAAIPTFTFYGNFIIEIPIAITAIYATFVLRLSPLEALQRVHASLVFRTGLVLFIFATLFALVRNEQSLVSIYGDLRCAFTILFTYCFLQSCPIESETSEKTIMRVCLYAGAFESLFIMLGIVTTHGSKYSAVVLASCAATVLASKQRNYFLFLIASTLLYYLSFRSGFRSFFIIGIATIIGSGLLILPKARIILTLGSLTLAGFIILTPVSTKSQNLASLSTSLRSLEVDHGIKRSTEFYGKTKNLIDVALGKASINISDRQRIDTWYHILNHPQFYIVPRGFGSDLTQTHQTKHARLGYIGILDSTITFIAYQYGILILITLLFLWLATAIKVISKINKLEVTASFIVLFLTINLYLFFTAEAFNVIAKSVSLSIFVYVLFHIVPNARTSKTVDAATASQT